MQALDALLEQLLHLRSTQRLALASQNARPASRTSWQTRLCSGIASACNRRIERQDVHKCLVDSLYGFGHLFGENEILGRVDVEERAQVGIDGAQLGGFNQTRIE